ncbi:MAG: acyl-CoA dehydrogenase family protein [Bacteriovoracaceae bacterium]|nr:acyl-CoA dehydrogenase family protein [Bacteriovoracaceae bacterium]
MNELQTELKNQLKKYCLDKIEPFMEEDDEKNRFRPEIYRGFGDYGICGIPLPEKFGGAELTYQDFILVLHEIAKYSVPYAVTLSVSTMVQNILNEFGTEAQKQKYLPALTSGEEIASFCLSESHSGSDAASLKTQAKKTKGGYILNGSKLWISTAGYSKTYLVMARTGGEGSSGVSAFIVRDDMKGFSVGKKEKKMGWRTSATAEVIFENCFVPEENLLGGTEGTGFKAAMSGLDRGRITIGAIACGLSERAIEESIQYALERKQFNQAIFDFQGLQFMMADMATENTASWLLVKEAAEQYDNKIKNSKLCAMAKLKATDTAMKITTDAVQILGGVGYTSEYPLERYMRDAKVLQIVEGTNQIQRVVIARELKKEFN